MSSIELKNLTGTAVPLGAICTEESQAIGEFPSLKKFAGFCKKANLKIIQLLPVNDTGTQSSPYSGLSAFALHPIYIQISALPEFNTLYKTDKIFKEEYDSFVKANPFCARYNYQNILNAKNSLLRKLYDSTSIAKNSSPSAELKSWIEKNTWVKSYSVFKALKWKYMQASWKSWSKKDQTPGIEEIQKRWEDKSLRKEHLFYAWTQMRANEQFLEAAQEVKKQGIILKGDMPIMMNEDSCDAWAHPEFFNHDLRAGSPVDGENPSGQNWGFPTYNWKNLKSAGYSWWKDRLISSSQYYGAYRLDHILGFFRIWAIPVRDTTAVLGHSEPCETISRKELYEIGFDDARINWLSQPHIPTGDMDYFTWNRDSSIKVLEKLCVRVGNEDLWNFKKEIKGDKDIYEADLSGVCSSEAEGGIKMKLADYWRSRTLIELSKDKFVPLWNYEHTYPWETLSYDERKNLGDLIKQKNEAQDKKWEKQATEILGELTSSVNMIPCGEDLGVNLPCVPRVMQKEKILGLRVMRWCRSWEKQDSPFVPLSSYDRLSICTTSVHDSPTLREWWNKEKDAAYQFAKANESLWTNFGLSVNADYEFSERVAEAILFAASKASSVWCIHPIQDFLYLNKNYYLQNQAQERINIPGEVTEFNWTYRMPRKIEEISNDEALCEKIKKIAEAHDNGGKNGKN